MNIKLYKRRLISYTEPKTHRQKNEVQASKAPKGNEFKDGKPTRGGTTKF